MTTGDRKTKASRTAVQSRGRWHRTINRLLIGSVGMVFLAASLMKAADMELFFRQILAYGIVRQPQWIVLVARTLVAFEFALGVGMLFCGMQWYILNTASATLLFFLGLTTWAWATGVTDDCGCFGGWWDHTPGEEAFQNLILLGMLIKARFGGDPRPVPLPRAGIWALPAACMAGLFLPLAFGFHLSAMTLPDPRISSQKIDLGCVKGVDGLDIERGRHLFFLMGTDCQHCQAVLGELDELAESVTGLHVLGLCKDDEKKRTAFEADFEPSFQLGQVEDKIFWRLLGKGQMPRIILFDKGRITKTWDRHVPSYDEVERAVSTS